MDILITNTKDIKISEFEVSDFAACVFKLSGIEVGDFIAIDRSHPHPPPQNLLQIQANLKGYFQYYKQRLDKQEDWDEAQRVFDLNNKGALTL